MPRRTASVVGLITAALVIAGCGSTKIVTRTVTTTHTVTEATTVTQTQTVTRTVASRPTTTTTTTSSSGKYRVIYRLSGNGSETIGTITIPASGATIAWTNDGSMFAFQSQLGSNSQAINVVSQSSSGDSFIYGGSYPDVQVNAVGNWRLVIVVPR